MKSGEFPLDSMKSFSWIIWFIRFSGGFHMKSRIWAFLNERPNSTEYIFSERMHTSKLILFRAAWGARIPIVLNWWTFLILLLILVKLLHSICTYTYDWFVKLNILQIKQITADQLVSLHVALMVVIPYLTITIQHIWNCMVETE